MNQRIKFLEDLNALLEKYGAEVTCDDHYKGWPECGQDPRITVEFDDYTVGDINFSTYIDTDAVKKEMRNARRLI